MKNVYVGALFIFAMIVFLASAVTSMATNITYNIAPPVPTQIAEAITLLMLGLMFLRPSKETVVVVTFASLVWFSNQMIHFYFNADMMGLWITAVLNIIVLLVDLPMLVKYNEEQGSRLIALPLIIMLIYGVWKFALDSTLYGIVGLPAFSGSIWAIGLTIMFVGGIGSLSKHSASKVISTIIVLVGLSIATYAATLYGMWLSTL